MQYNIIVVYTTAIFIECNLSLKQYSDQNSPSDCQCYTNCNSCKFNILYAAPKNTSHHFITIVKLL